MRLQAQVCTVIGIAALSVLFAAGYLEGQQSSNSDSRVVEAMQHVLAARDAGRGDHAALFNRICVVLPTDLPNSLSRRAAPSEYDLLLPGGSPLALASIPEEEPWRTEPFQVFDNMYYVGDAAHNSWAVATSEGIVLIDAIYDYAVEAQVVGGLTKLGFDPADIRYVIISHGHADHVGGAAFLQQRYGARIVMPEEEWRLIESSDAGWPKPRRDMVATDGQQIRLGDVVFTLMHTPGHTPGTLSTLITPLRDGDRTHVAAHWGGTAFTNADPARLRQYIESAERFGAAARQAGADVIISNHPLFDATVFKAIALTQREVGDRHPYVIGAESVARFFTVAQECARASLSARR